MKRKHTEADLEVSAVLREAFNLIHQRFAHDTLAIMHEAGLTMPQMVTLFALSKFGPHTVSRIAERLRLSAAATSHLVERLVLGHFVERVEDAGDRRQKRVSISAGGRELLARFDRSRTDELTMAVEKLSPGLRRELREVLEKVVAELRDSEPEAAASRGRAGSRCRGEDKDVKA